MAYSQPIADVLREFFVLSNIDAGFEEQAGCGVFTSALWGGPDKSLCCQK